MNTSGSAQPVSSVSTSKDPWTGAQATLLGMYGGANSLQQAGTGTQPYGGQRVADWSPEMQTGAAYLGAELAPNALGSQNNAWARADAAEMLGNQGLNANEQQLWNQNQGQQNPYLQQIMDTMNRRIGDRIGSQFSGSGRYGSGQMQDVTARALGESEAPIMAQDYEARQARLMSLGQGGANAMGQWAQLEPSIEAQQYAPAKEMMGLGSMETGQQQALLDAARNYYNESQQMPWQALSNEAGIVSGAGSIGGTQVANTSQFTPNLWQRVLGGGLAGGGMGSAFGPALI
jgi:hypothetical protein